VAPGLRAACPSCSTSVTQGKKFCRSCGAALTTEPAGRFPSPESYTPRHLAEKILTSKAVLEGERKQPAASAAGAGPRFRADGPDAEAYGQLSSLCHLLSRPNTLPRRCSPWIRRDVALGIYDIVSESDLKQAGERLTAFVLGQKSDNLPLSR
jgi:hypothetical protein